MTERERPDSGGSRSFSHDVYAAVLETNARELVVGLNSHTRGPRIGYPSEDRTGQKYNPWELILANPSYDEARTMEADPLWHGDRAVLTNGTATVTVVHDAKSDQWFLGPDSVPEDSRDQAIAVLLRRSADRLARSPNATLEGPLANRAPLRAFRTGPEMPF